MNPSSSEPSSTPSSETSAMENVSPSSLPSPDRPGVLASVWRGIVFVWKFLAGAALTQSILGGVLVVGWGYRFMQRSILKRWWQRSPHRGKHRDFSAWLATQDPRHPHRHWPNWFVRQNFSSAPDVPPGQTRLQRARRALTAPFQSFALNLTKGIRGLFNTWVLTMPGCLLMLFSWYDGWNNSFNKGYEQAPIGPLTGVLGIALFLAAMLYVPLAQARQASTGDWRSFYQFKLVWGMVRRHWLACLFLAAAYALASLPFTVIKTAPNFFAQNNEAIAQFTPEQASQFLRAYFFGFALLLFPLWMGLRLLAARLYASAVLHGLQTGKLNVFDLAEVERKELGNLDLVQIHPPRSRHVLLQVASTTSAGLVRMLATAITVLVWFAFVAQIYIAEFLMYHPVQGWINQPLVQLPWFIYLPPQLQNPGPEIALTLLFLAVVFSAASTLRRTAAFFQRRRDRVLTM